MKTSQKGIDLIKKYEGCVLTAYKCPAGVYTIGYGHTEGVYPGQKITREEAESFLKKDLKRFEDHVNAYNKKYNFNQNQFDALVSFAYNIGSLDQLTQNGTRSKYQIADMMLEYIKAGGTIMPGLINRRREERQLFITNAPEAPAVNAPELKEGQKVKTVVDMIVSGKFGNGNDRKNALYEAFQKLVNARFKK